MEVKICERNKVCNCFGCNTAAKFEIGPLTDEGKCYLCEACVRKLGSEIGKCFVPRAVESKFKNKTTFLGGK